MRLFIGRYFCCACFGLALANSATGEDASTVVTDAAKSFLESKKHVTLAIGIITPAGKQEFRFGNWKVGDAEIKPDEHTLYEIGSITKAFTGTLLAQLVLEKKVKLDDPVQPWLPGDWKLPRRDDRDITFLHLATHTSSLPPQPPGLGWLALLSGNSEDPYGNFDSAAVAKTLEKLRLEHPIGFQHEYSNLGVGLMGHALARADNVESFEALLSKRILEPLAMNQTSIRLTDERKKKLAPGHNEFAMSKSGWNFATLEACGGIRSNVGDMLRFLEASMGQSKSPLQPAFQFAQQPWRDLPVKDVAVGLCWMRTSSKTRGLLIWHNGGTGGYASFMGFRPKTGVGVVVLCNGASREVDKLGLEILNGLAK